MKTYKVNQITKNLNITGKGDSSLWDKANVLTDFKSPWDSKAIDRIQFKALWDNECFFFCFRVEDTNVYIDKTDNTKASINNSDRVELFFRQDKNLNPYYCFEIDPLPRVMDFIAHPNKNFNFNWNWPKAEIDVKSSFDDYGFTVEGVISIKSLKAFNLIKDNVIETGIYRAKYYLQKDGSYEPTWITWIDPKTETPNFHIASSFGLLKLEE
ncbi:sugar-binding protein [Aestuariivivens marinum]|uniref:sugar-binding protein n=1 Tax=Aestuariivivens marinum TaxID=2913555 RepID=UPI001F5932E9|nr:sugar-binding protein [Aestuariivivens marinum]